MKRGDCDGSEFEVEDAVEFVGWRRDGWVSLLVGDQAAGMLEVQKKMRSDILPDFRMNRRVIASKKVDAAEDHDLARSPYGGKDH